MITHLKNTRYLHGGHVYRQSIKAMLAINDPHLNFDELFVHHQQHHAWRLCRQIYDLLTSPFTPFPAKVNHFRTRAFRQRLAAALAERDYSLVVISGADMLWCLDCLPRELPLLYLSHNIEHLLYHQQVAKYQAIPGLGQLLKADADKFKAFELEHLKGLRRVVTIAAADHAMLQAYCPQARIATVMPAFDSPPCPLRPRPTGALRLGFLGNLEWWPNRRSLRWFLEEVFRKVNADIELHLYGQGSAAYHEEGKIYGHGFVHDLSEVWTGVDLLIQPITCGAGMNIKVAEALYNRRPMIATPLALRGMPLVEDPAITVLAEAGAWIDYLNGPGPAEQATKTIRRQNAELFSLEKNRLALKALLADEGPVVTRPSGFRG